MTISLKPEQQRVVDLAIQSGAYQNPGEVIDQALAIIREQLELEDWMLERRKAVAAQIESEAAVLKLADPGSPTLIQDKESRGALYVLMPMRV